MEYPQNRALCVQMMKECAAAAEVTGSGRMKMKLLDLTVWAAGHGWLPECFTIKPNLLP